MKTCRRRNRAGNVLVLTAVMMVILVGMVAFALDVGYLYVGRTELQRTADAAAIAAATRLQEEEGLLGEQFARPSAAVEAAARQFAAANPVAGAACTLADGDWLVGELADPTDPGSAILTSDPTRFNVVQIRVRRSNEVNGQVGLFFARVLGINGASMGARARAGFCSNFRGFTAPPDGKCLPILPIAMDEETWCKLVTPGNPYNFPDNWSWDKQSKTITPDVSDGVPEVNLYPNGTTPGNWGTVDIGASNNSTADLARQVLHGISKEDLACIGGCLKLDENGVKMLEGDTGISAGIKDELAAIKGQPRIIPLYRPPVMGPGNNAMYTIVGWAGVRILDVKLTGSMSSKRVIIQPACVTIRGGIPGDGPPHSHFVFSPVRLLQ